MSWHIYPAAAAAAVRRSVRPCRHGTKRVLFSRHLLHVGRYSSGLPDRWWWSVDIFAAERHIYLTKRKREIWVSLSRRARIPHSTRTKVHGSAPLHHTTNLHYTTCLYLLHTTTTATKMPYVSNQGCLFFLQCRALTRDIRYTLPPSTYHAPLQGGRTTPSSPAVSYIHVPY